MGFVEGGLQIFYHLLQTKNYKLKKDLSHGDKSFFIPKIRQVVAEVVPF
jgi:hypothetical protein